MTSPQTFEYRLPVLNEPRQKWLVALAIVMLVATLSLQLISIFRLNEADRQTGAIQTQTRTTPRSLPSAAQDASGKHTNHVRKLAILAPLILLMFGLILWVGYSAPRRYSLTLSDDVLKFSFRLPPGLKNLLGTDWAIPLNDIARIESVLNPMLLLANAQAPAVMQIRIRPRKGLSRTLTPTTWFNPGDPASTPLKPMGRPRWFEGSAAYWMRPENQALLQSNFDDLPLVRALRARGIEVPPLGPLGTLEQQDLFAVGSIKFGILAGLASSVFALAIIVGRGILSTTSSMHFAFDLPVFIYPLLCGAALFGMWQVSRRDYTRPPIWQVTLAAVFLIAGVAFVTPQLAFVANNLGARQELSQDFVVRKGSLVPTDNRAGIGTIPLPGKQIRAAWLKEETRVTLTIRKGNLGLWEYDDLALRRAADDQGIR